MSNIISLSQKKIINGLYQEVYDARTLHTNLQSKKKFADWIKSRLQDFVEGIDFISFSPKCDNIYGGRPLREYYITQKVVISCIQQSLHLSIMQKQRLFIKYNIKKNILTTRQEIEFIDTLIKILEPFDYQCIRQYRVLEYKIDLYIKDINIAIEYDEKYHQQQIIQDDIRENRIKNKLKCKFIRVSNKDSHLWNCGYVIKQLFNK